MVLKAPHVVYTQSMVNVVVKEDLSINMIENRIKVFSALVNELYSPLSEMEGEWG